MLLTSYRRILFALGGKDILTNNFQNKRNFANWIPAISARIENFINRFTELTSHTEYFDSLENSFEYFVKGYPITALTSVKSDSTGEFNGSESSESNYFIGKNQNSVGLAVSLVPAIRGLQIIYTGGLAAHGTQSTFELTNEGSTPFVADKYVEGQDSLAMGYVISKSSSTIVIEVLYGIFQVGEQIKGKSAWDSPTFETDMEADIDSVTTRCLAETYPDIVRACELEIRYMNDHKSDFENTNTAKGTTTRKDMEKDYGLLPEVRSLLQDYVNIYV